MLVIDLNHDFFVNGFHCHLVRVSADEMNLSLDINYEISFIVGGDGSYRRILLETGVRRSPMFEFPFDGGFVDGRDIMSLLEENTLTICCRIWSEKMFFPYQCLLRTRIGTQKRCLKVSMPKDQKNFERQLLYSLSGNFSTIVVFQWINEKLIGHVKVQQSGSEYKQKVTCVVHVLDSSGNSVLSGEGRLQLGGQYLKTLAFPPFLSRKWLSDNGDKCLVNDNLNMCVEIEMSNGVLTGELETIYYDENATSFAEERKFEADKNSSPTSSLVSGLLSLYQEQKLCDVTIQTESSSFPVHKTILCAQSPVFTAMFEVDMEEKKTGVVKIPNLTEDTVQQMLLFMYTNKVEDLEWESALNLFSAADQYRITSLKLMCKNLLIVKLSVTNVTRALLAADFYNDDEWKSVVHQFILERDSEVIASVLWNEFVQNHAQLAAETMHVIYLQKLEI